MRVLFDLGHPAHYHLFKNTIRELRRRKDQILIVVRNREDIVAELLKEDGEEHIIFGGNPRGLIKKAIYMIILTTKLLRISSRFRPDLFVSMSSPYSGQTSFFLRKPHLSFTDTEISKIVILLLIPFTTKMITPSSFRSEFSFRNQIKIDSYKELAYLHPKYFMPDSNIIAEIGIGKHEKFAIVRLSAYDSSHDVGLKGLTEKSVERLVFGLSKIARVFISSEIRLNEELEKFALKIKPTKMHDLLNYASIYIGEGAVMASEAAMLGVPSVFINPSRRGYLDELQELGLVRHFRNPNEDIEKIIKYSKEILASDDYRKKWKEKRNSMLEIKEDLTAIILSEIDGFRKS